MATTDVMAAIAATNPDSPFNADTVARRGMTMPARAVIARGANRGRHSVAAPKQHRPGGPVTMADTVEPSWRVATVLRRRAPPRRGFKTAVAQL